MNLISLFITSVLTENIILNKFLGMCPFFGVSQKEEGTLGMGLAVTLVVTLSSLTTYFLYYSILVPSDTEYLKTILFILVIASFVQLFEMITKKFFKSLHELLGIYLPLITTNCAVLGIVLLNIQNEYTLSEVLVYAIGSSLGYLLIIYIFGTIRDRIDHSPVIKSFKGLPIALITAFIMALVFTRYIGN
ncbi:MAG: Rnf-Nqr domain containing protein [Bacilli bacterium]|jgi:electron transport complex protein RnfA